MAQLPPKAPAMPQKWPSFSYQTMPVPVPLSASLPPSWMDDFIDFSSSRRNCHRRSASDPVAFMETPFINECRNSNANDSLMPCSNSNGFERLDDEQLSSMFSDEVVEVNLQLMRSSSTPIDQNSDIDEPNLTPRQEQLASQLKKEPGEVEDGGGYEQETETVKPPITFSSEGGTIVDPKRIKRYH